MAKIPTVITVEADHLTGVNRVFAALGMGEGYVSAACVHKDGENTPETPATHYYAQDMAAEVVDVAIWQAMCDGTLPSGPSWGENGVITSEEALAALGHMRVASEAGVKTPQEAEDFLAGVLVGKSLVKRKEPDSAF